jgi:hypothetical protein
MADGVLLDFAAFFDCFEDDAEDICGNQRVARKHRPVLDVIETAILRERVLQDDRAADNIFAVCECDPKFSKPQVCRKSTLQEDCMKPVSRVPSKNVSHAFHRFVGKGSGDHTSEISCSHCCRRRRRSGSGCELIAHFRQAAGGARLPPELQLGAEWKDRSCHHNPCSSAEPDADPNS